MRLFVFICGLFATLNVQGQETREIFMEPTKGFRELFSVQLKDTTIKEGAYVSTFQDVNFCDGNYKAGERTGLWNFHHFPSGKPTYSYDYTLKQFEGPFATYFDDGKPSLTVTYKNGKREGDQRAYYPEGAVLDNCPFVNGEANGRRTHFFEDGTLNFEQEYLNGKRDGTGKFYHQNKQLLLEVVYRNGKLLNIIALNDSTGKALDPGTFKDGNGIRNMYFDNGTLQHTFEYRDGQLNGSYKEFRKDKTLFIEGTFSNNAPSGTWKFLEDNGKEFSAYDFEIDSLIRINKELTSRMLNYENRRMHYIQWCNKLNTKIIEANPDMLNNEIQVFELSAKKKTYEHDLATGMRMDATFPGGDKQLMTYLQENITYPVYEKENQIMGTIYMSFIVEKDGRITEIKPIKTVKNGYGLVKEATRVISLMPNWTPGLMNGASVRVSCSVPIKFVLR